MTKIINKTVFELNEDQVSIITSIAFIDNQIKELELIKKEKQEALKSLTDGKNTDFTFDGKKLMSYTKYTQERFDTSKFKEEQPEKYFKYVKSIEIEKLTMSKANSKN